MLNKRKDRLVRYQYSLEELLYWHRGIRKGVMYTDSHKLQPKEKYNKFKTFSRLRFKLLQKHHFVYLVKQPRIRIPLITRKNF